MSPIKVCRSQSFKVVYRTHQSILKLIKVRYNQNTFIVLKFLNFKIFDQKIVLQFFGKVKTIKALGGFELMTYLVNTYRPILQP